MTAIADHYHLIILGTGLAGYTLAREYRKLDTDSSLALVTRDDGAWYSKPMLSNALTKNKTAPDLATRSSDDMAESLGATLVTHCDVDTIDAAGKSLVVQGQTVHYDALVLCNGASQINLPIAGEGAADVLTVNDLEDYAAFRERLEGVDHVAIMGPGLIGCEFANDLVNAGINVSVIGPDTAPLERLIPPEASQSVKTALSALGVSWHLETVVDQIDRTDLGYRLSLANGESLDAGLVLSAVGLRPNTELATGAGIDAARGILVDRHFRTSASHIYALGDCMELNDMLLPYVLPIMHGAKSLAQTLAGSPTPVVLPAMPVAIKTPAHPIVVANPPPQAVGEWQTESDDEGVRALYQSADGVLLGFVLTGNRVKEKMKLERTMPAVLS